MAILSYLFNLACTVYSILILVRGIVIWAKLDESNPLLQWVVSLTEPVLSKVRPLFPKATFDISPIVVIVGIYIVVFVFFQLLALMAPRPVYYTY